MSADPVVRWLGRESRAASRRRATGGAVVLRPKDVRAQLAVSASTLRHWSELFKDYLSPAAQVPPEIGSAHRRYTPGDVQVLAQIGQLIHLGHRYQEVRQLVPPPAHADEPVERQLSIQGAERDGRIRMLERALAEARARIEALEEQWAACERLLAAERTAKAEGQRKLIEALRANQRLLQANLGLHAQVAQLERERDAPVWKRIFQ